MVQSCRVVRGENSCFPPAMRPESSSTVTHLAMSDAPDMIPPAGLVLSLENGAICLTFPSIGAWVAATLPPPVAPEWRTSLARIPTGTRIRERTKSSQVWPLTASISSPATE